MLSGYLLFKYLFSRHSISDENEDINGEPDQMTRILMGPVDSFKDYVRKKSAASKVMENLPFEVLQIISEDGLKLSARLYRTVHSGMDKTAILVHGYNMDGIHDYAQIVPEYLERGWNCLLPDNRACGQSEGTYQTFGAMESRDTSLWVGRIAEEMPGTRIVLHGTSLGGATVCIMSSMDLPGDVRAVIADCPYKDMYSVLSRCINAVIGFCPELILKDAGKWLKRKTGVDYWSVTPLKAVEDSKLPILFVHGSDDGFVPLSNSETLFEACVSEKQLLITKGAGHAQCSTLDPDTYYSTIFSFLDRYC